MFETLMTHCLLQKCDTEKLLFLELFIGTFFKNYFATYLSEHGNQPIPCEEKLEICVLTWNIVQMQAA